MRAETGADFAECRATDTALTFWVTLGCRILDEIGCAICRCFVATEDGVRKRFPDCDTTGSGLSDTEISRDWRNAIAHQDFELVGGDETLGLAKVRAWRRALSALADDFDGVMYNYLMALLGNAPW